MAKYIDFETYEYSRDLVPEHIQVSLENYLMHGYTPGGFVGAMLAGDLYKAASSADHISGPAMCCIANWIIHCAPHGSWGSYENVRFWLDDGAGLRTKYADKVRKEYIIRVLKD